MTENGGAVRQYLDYYPFGALRVDEQYGYTNERHKFTGHELDDQTGLYYMQARYQLPTVGRFVSEDPSFLDSYTRDMLVDPQSTNSYSYTRNNPLRMVDKNGKWFEDVLTGQQSLSGLQIEVGQATQQMTQDSAAWNFAVDHPIYTGAAVGLASIVAAESAVTGLAALNAATDAGVGLQYAGTKLAYGAFSLYLAGDSLNNISDLLVDSSDAFNTHSLRSYGKLMGNIALTVGPSIGGMIGGRAAVVGTIVDMTTTSYSVAKSVSGARSSSSSSSSGTSASQSSASRSPSSSSSSSSVNWAAAATAVKLYYGSGGK